MINLPTRGRGMIDDEPGTLDPARDLLLYMAAAIQEIFGNGQLTIEKRQQQLLLLLADCANRRFTRSERFS